MGYDTNVTQFFRTPVLKPYIEPVRLLLPANRRRPRIGAYECGALVIDENETDEAKTITLIFDIVPSSFRKLNYSTVPGFQFELRGSIWRCTESTSDNGIICALAIKAVYVSPIKEQEHKHRIFRKDPELAALLIPMRVERISERGNLIYRNVGALPLGVRQSREGLVQTFQLEWTRSDFWQTAFDIDETCTFSDGLNRYRCSNMRFQEFPKFVEVDLLQIRN